MKVIDFRNAPFGMLVTYSDHWNTERCVKKGKPKKIGIMTDRKFYQDDVSGIIVTWPIVFWEGEVMATWCHPANIAPYRKNVMNPIKYIEVSD